LLPLLATCSQEIFTVTSHLPGNFVEALLDTYSVVMEIISQALVCALTDDTMAHKKARKSRFVFIKGSLMIDRVYVEISQPNLVGFQEMENDH
jgi:hypothetical protein